MSHFPLDPGTHALNWFVFGPPGSTYTMEITAPESLKFKHEGTLDKDQKDAGLHWITITA